MFKTLKFVAKAYGAVSGAVGTIAHPIRSAQDSIRGYLVKKCVNAVVAVAGERIAQELVARVQVEKPVALEIKVHRRARSLVLDPDTLALIGTLVNDALAAPLSAVGVRIGAMAFEASDSGERLKITGVFKLESSAEPARKLLRNAA